MSQLTPSQITQMIDLSAVRFETDDEGVRSVVETARRYACGLVSVLPAQTAHTRRLLDLLGNDPPIRLGGNVGFPSGGQTTAIKAAEARELALLGCDELDMVVDMAALRSGRDADTLSDIRAVVEAAGGIPVKVIFECHYLTAGQIRIGCDLAIEAGAAFVKTGTGWAPTGATPMRISIIKKHVGDRIQIKAAGGIRSLDMILEMYELGARRFGISVRTGSAILAELAARKEPFDIAD
jgi:deoxyribose-phosphate aldolase